MRCQKNLLWFAVCENGQLPKAASGNPPAASISNMFSHFMIISLQLAQRRTIKMSVKLRPNVAATNLDAIHSWCSDISEMEHFILDGINKGYVSQAAYP